MEGGGGRGLYSGVCAGGGGGDYIRVCVRGGGGGGYIRVCGRGGGGRWSNNFHKSQEFELIMWPVIINGVGICYVLNVCVCSLVISSDQ